MTLFFLIILGSCTIAVPIWLLLNRLENRVDFIPDDNFSFNRRFDFSQLPSGNNDRTVRFSEITLASAERALASLEGRYSETLEAAHPKDQSGNFSP